MVFGINVSFAGVRLGKQITDPSALKAGDKILLRAGSVNSGTEDVYKWVASLADSMVWANNTLVDEFLDPYTAFSLESAEGTIKDKPTFYIKNEANGMYLAYVFEETTENEDGEQEGSITENEDGELNAELRLIYVADKAAAAPFAFVLASEGTQWGGYTGDKKPETSDVMVYTTCKEYSDSELLISINQNYDTPWIANYVDWAAWFAIYEPLFTTSYIDDLNILYSKVGELTYVGGTDFGCYDPALVEAFDKAKAQASSAVTAISPDEATCEAAYKALEKAWLALAVAKPVPIVSGYYKFRNAQADDTNYKLMKAVPGLLKWVNWNKVPDVSCVWELIDRNDGTFYMRNLYTQEYVSTTGAKSETGSPSITMSKDSTDNTVYFINKNNGYFVIKQRGDNSLHAESVGTSGAGSEKNIVAWNYSDDGNKSASHWAFEILSEDSIAYYKSLANQAALDEALADLIALAQEKYNIGAKYDAYLTSPAQIWSNAANMSTDDVYTNPRGVWGTGADGGGYPALLDNNESTYFHSAWNGTIAEYHYLQFDLSENPTDKFFFTFTRRPNTTPVNKNRPKTIAITATNDTTDGGVWTDTIFVSNIDVTSPTVISEEIALDAPYKYLRFTVKETNTMDQLLNGYPFFALSEFHLYSADLNENCQNASAIAEQASALKEALAVAREVETGKTTQDDIDKLQAAYDNYIAVLADPTELKAAYDKAQVAYDQAVTETTVAASGEKMYPDPGTYRDADKATFKAVLDQVKAYLDANDNSGAYTSEGIAEQLAALMDAQEAFKKTVRWINAADADQEGTWYYISTAQRYADVPANVTAGRAEGVIYVMPNGANENKTIYWATRDSIAKQNIGEEYAQWRFINLGDTAYAIQNRATQMYIGQYQTHPASLSIAPVAFKVSLSEVGYGSFFFKGTYLTGEPVNNNYLHSQEVGQTLVYWDDEAGKGSAWDIYTTDVNRTEVGEIVDSYQANTIDFFEAQKGKLYAMSYPVALEYVADELSLEPVYTIASINEDELTLVSKGYDPIEAGEPFFYLCANDQSLLQANPTAADTIMVQTKILDEVAMKTFAQQPLTVNGLVGNYAGVTLPAGMGYLKETTTTDEEGIFTSRVQTIASTTKNQEIGRYTPYINAGLIENTEPGAATITIKIDGNLDTAIKDAIINTQKGNVNVYSIDGVLIKKNVKASKATEGLSKGIYIVGNSKVVVK